jgi:hypothetical protein
MPWFEPTIPNNKLNCPERNKNQYGMDWIEIHIQPWLS